MYLLVGAGNAAPELAWDRDKGALGPVSDTFARNRPVADAIGNGGHVIVDVGFLADVNLAVHLSVNGGNGVAACNVVLVDDVCAVKAVNLIVDIVASTVPLSAPPLHSNITIPLHLRCGTSPAILLNFV